MNFNAGVNAASSASGGLYMEHMIVLLDSMVQIATSHLLLSYVSSSVVAMESCMYSIQGYIVSHA